MGGYSEENISGGTSKRIGCQSETSEDCSGHRRLDCPSRPRTLGSVKTHKSQLRSVERNGFSQSSSSDRLTDEQNEDLIAENIYDWWISGKSYKKWYADKFLQLKFEFPEEI